MSDSQPVQHEGVTDPSASQNDLEITKPSETSDTQAQTSEKNLPEEEKKVENETQPPNPSCKTCGKSDTELSKCGGCGKVRYCSQDCQKKDWKNHKTDCKFKPPPEKIKEPSEPEDKSDLYDHLKLVGEGNFSQIFLAKRRDKDQTYAMKVVNKQRVKMLHKENDLVMEKHCLIKLKESEYVIDFIDAFDNFLNVYLVMEYMPGGELWDIVKCFGLPSQSIVKYFFSHVVNAVSACHEKGIVHRDLKPENIMLDGTKTKLKLVDFGTAKDVFDPSVVPSGNASHQGRKNFQHYVGTPHYMPPECIRNKGSDYKSDVWAMGCILYQLITGFPPFLGASDYLIFTKALKDDPNFPEFLDWGVAKDLILKMMTREPEGRYSLEDVKNHEYFKGTDWANIGSYKSYEESATLEEKFWSELRSQLREFSEEREPVVNEKDVERTLGTFNERLEKSEQFDESQKSKLQARIKFARRQARAYSNIEAFEW